MLNWSEHCEKWSMFISSLIPVAIVHCIVVVTFDCFVFCRKDKQIILKWSCLIVVFCLFQRRSGDHPVTTAHRWRCSVACHRQRHCCAQLCLALLPCGRWNASSLHSSSGRCAPKRIVIALLLGSLLWQHLERVILANRQDWIRLYQPCGHRAWTKTRNCSEHRILQQPAITSGHRASAAHETSGKKWEKALSCEKNTKRSDFSHILFVPLPRHWGFFACF